MKKFVYTVTKKTWNRMYGHGYIYLSVSEIREVEDDKDCPIHHVVNFKVPSGANVTSEVMKHLAKIGKISQEHICGEYVWHRPPVDFRIWEI